MLNNPKRAIWEALILAVFVFSLGFFIGFVFESSQTAKMNDYYINSEYYLLDIVALDSLVDQKIFDCPSLYETYSGFADKVYNEALLLEKYESSEQVTEEMKIVHKRYDLLRVFLWANLIKTSNKCKDVPHVIVYLYEYSPDDLAKKATQNVWSKILSDLKEEKGKEIILIPIASDLDIDSLDALLGNFNISSYPALIVDNKHVLEEIVSLEELKKYIN